jgi:hypothetical protein
MALSPPSLDPRTLRALLGTVRIKGIDKKSAVFCRALLRNAAVARHVNVWVGTTRGILQRTDSLLQRISSAQNALSLRGKYS